MNEPKEVWMIEVRDINQPWDALEFCGTRAEAEADCVKWNAADGPEIEYRVRRYIPAEADCSCGHPAKSHYPTNACRECACDRLKNMEPPDALSEALRDALLQNNHIKPFTPEDALRLDDQEQP